MSNKRIDNNDYWQSIWKRCINSYKFMLVQCIENKNLVDKFLVAVDGVGAGIGEDVIITTGSSARVAIGDANSPVDATIVGILDEKQC